MEKINIKVDNRIRVCTGWMPVDVGLALQAAFEHPNPQWKKLRAMGYAAGGEEEVIATWERGDGELSFPRGGMKRVRRVLSEHGREWVVKDNRRQGKGPSLSVKHALTLRPYQETAVAEMMKRENCLLRAGTGSGKTTVGFALAARIRRSVLVIVWTGALFDQWQKRSRTELGYEPGIIRGSKRELKPLTIAMQQTLAAQGVDEELRSYFGVVICDEVQRFAAKTLFAAVDPFPARYRFGISADESRKDKKEFLTYDLFGEAAADIPREQLAADGHVLEVEVRVVLSGFQAPWYAQARMESRRPGKQPAFDRLLAAMAEDTARNAMITTTVANEIAAGERVFVLSHRREHCRILDAGISAHGHRSGLLLGGQDYAVEFQRSLEALISGDYRAGVGTYQAIGQGLDVPPVGVAFCATPIASNKQLVGQVRGRVCRPSPETGKKGARMYYLHDPRVFGWTAIRNLAKENQRVVVWSKGAWVEAKEFLRGITKTTGGDPDA